MYLSESLYLTFETYVFNLFSSTVKLGQPSHDTKTFDSGSPNRKRWKKKYDFRINPPVVHHSQNRQTIQSESPASVISVYTLVKQIPTDLFTIFNPENRPFEVFYVARKRRSTDCKAPKLWKRGRVPPPHFPLEHNHHLLTQTRGEERKGITWPNVSQFLSWSTNDLYLPGKR